MRRGRGIQVDVQHVVDQGRERIVGGRVAVKAHGVVAERVEGRLRLGGRRGGVQAPGRFLLAHRPELPGQRLAGAWAHGDRLNGAGGAWRQDDGLGRRLVIAVG